jgi:predicted dehydrogenase
MARHPIGDRIRVGIIGAGRFAATHINAYRQLPGVEILALSRRNAEALKAARSQWDVPYTYLDYRDLLAMDEIDAVSIVTPTDTHFRIIMDAIDAGKHVLCEKPLTLRASEARAALDAAEKRGVVHAVNFNQRGRTAVGGMARHIAAGFIGELCHINIWWGITFQYDVRPEIGSWRFRPETGGGTIHEMVHVFDFARFLAGEVKRLVAMASTSERRRPFPDAPEGANVNVPDSSAYLLEFESGATGVIHTSFVARGVGPSGKSEPRVEVTGTRGRIVTVEGTRLQGISGAQGPLRDLDPGEPYPQPYEQFIRALSAGSPVQTSFHDGYKAAELIDAAYLSIAERRWVELG